MLLDKINSPLDLRSLPEESLPQVCKEIRQHLIDCCSSHPGHVGSSLGAVELIVALHYVYDTPKDKLVFDVSHQAYAHKILTGRREAMRSLRTKGGISGFTKPSESEWDAFVAGHASNSISAALGYAKAATLKGEKIHSIAFIGDGALTGGLALEGMNNAGADPDNDILIILNDNNISISNNVGALHNYLLKLTTNPLYNKVKQKVWESLGESRMRSKIQKKVRKWKSGMVSTTGGSLFEAMGFRYFGPIDGNNPDQVVDTLRKIKDLRGPKVLHAITMKGKGFQAAENDPVTWHAPGKFNPQTGERLKGSVGGPAKYQDVFGQTLLDLAREHDEIVGVTPAMLTGCSMNMMQAEFPDRVFDVGIEEEHAVTFSAGLASGGLRPFCNIYSSFSQRAYDEIIHDVALQSLPVVLCFDRAGLVGEDGATHHGCFDLAAYRSIPGMTIAAPSDELELRNLMYTAYRHSDGPFIIRYPRGCGCGVQWESKPYEVLPLGKSTCVRAVEKPEVSILCLGPVLENAMKALEIIGEDASGIEVWDVRYLKPFDLEMMSKVAASGSKIVTIEDGCLKGGLYSEVLECLCEMKAKVEVHGIGIPDNFIEHGSVAELQAECGLDPHSIAMLIKDISK